MGRLILQNNPSSGCWVDGKAVNRITVTDHDTGKINTVVDSYNVNNMLSYCNYTGSGNSYEYKLKDNYSARSVSGLIVIERSGGLSNGIYETTRIELNSQCYMYVETNTIGDPDEDTVTLYAQLGNDKHLIVQELYQFRTLLIYQWYKMQFTDGKYIISAGDDADNLTFNVSIQSREIFGKLNLNNTGALKSDISVGGKITEGIQGKASALKDMQGKIINPLPLSEDDKLRKRLLLTPMIPRDKDPYWIHKREMEELEKNKNND